MKSLLLIYAFCCTLSCCLAETLWTEGFESTFPSGGWITNSVEQSTTYAFNGSSCARLNATSDYLITPQISNAQTLIFWSYTTASDPAIVVEYAPDITGPWTATAGSPFSGYTEQWNGQVIDLSGLGSIHIRFRKTGSGTLYIDDVSVEAGRAASNCPPTLNPIGNHEVGEQGSLSFTVTASDPVDNNTFTLTATNLPHGAFFTNGVFTWNSAAPAGIYAVTFYATDKDGTVSETITITVTAAVTGNSRIAGNFYGWSGDTIFKLENGKFWQQCAAGVKTISPALYRPYVTVTNIFGQRRMVVTNVTGYAAVAPLSVAESTVTNSFSGLHYRNIYQFADGTAWEQISFENIQSETSPVTVWRWMKNGQPMLRFLDRNNVVIGTCTAEASMPLVNAPVASEIDGYFHGFGHGNIYRLADGSWWKQISFERSGVIRLRPRVFIWNKNGIDHLEMPDENIRVAVEKLNVQLESTAAGTFTGMHYGNLYRLANGESWLQISFENIRTNIVAPEVMLWINKTGTNLLARSGGIIIGTCTVVNPALDEDHDGLSNAAEVLADSDPLNAQSWFELRQTDRCVLSWDSVDGRVYTIEWTPALTENFQPLATGIVWPQNSWTDAVHNAESKGYYRITVRFME